MAEKGKRQAIIEPADGRAFTAGELASIFLEVPGHVVPTVLIRWSGEIKQITIKESQL